MSRTAASGSLRRRKRRNARGEFVETGPWHIYYYHNGRKIEESSRSLRKSDAQQLLKQRMLEIEQGKFSPIGERLTVADLLDDLLDDFETNQKRSLDWVRFVDGHLRPFFGALKPSEVGTAQINAYIRHRREHGISNSTVNRELNRLRRAFSLAAQPVPPKVKNVPKIPKLKEPPPRSGFFEYDEFVALRAELPEHLRPVITFAYYTGCRKGEILCSKASSTR